MPDFRSFASKAVANIDVFRQQAKTAIDLADGAITFLRAIADLLRASGGQLSEEEIAHIESATRKAEADHERLDEVFLRQEAGAAEFRKVWKAATGGRS